MPLLVAVMAQTDQIPILFPLKGIKNVQRILRMLLDKLIVMHSGCLFIDSFFLTVLAFPVIHRQNPLPESAPLRRHIEPVHIILFDALLYKFNIAFENSSVLGYTTEKIMDAMVANTIPIYWGNRWIGRDFNESSFINVHAFGSLEDAVERIVELDSDDEQYMKLMNESWISDTTLFDWEKRLSSFLINIIEKPLDEARYLVNDGMQKLYKQNIKTLAFVDEKLKVHRLISAYRKLKAKL